MSYNLDDVPRLDPNYEPAPPQRYFENSGPTVHQIVFWLLLSYLALKVLTVDQEIKPPKRRNPNSKNPLDANWLTYIAGKIDSEAMRKPHELLSNIIKRLIATEDLNPSQKDFLIYLLVDAKKSEERGNKKNPKRRRKNPAKPFSTHYLDDKYHLGSWFERDRAHVALENETNGQLVVEWWDDDYLQAVEDGFLNPKKLKDSAEEYALDHGLIIMERRPKLAVVK